MSVFKKVFFAGITLLTIVTICADNGKGTQIPKHGQHCFEGKCQNDATFRKQLVENVNEITEMLKKDNTEKCSYVKFYLYTEIDESGIPISTEVSEKTEHIKLNSDNPGYLKIMIHGALGFKDDAFNIAIRKSYFEVDDKRNILAVDYEFLGNNLLGMKLDGVYDVVELVATCTQRILNKIINENSGNEIKTHVIGFSLGAQIGGSLANKLQIKNDGGVPTISRITALQPSLTFFEGKTISILNKNSAGIVDVLYTSDGGIGQAHPIGTHTFYANGGFCQPNCAEFDNNGYNCSHKRAYALFAESILYVHPSCGFFSKRRGLNDPIRYSLGANKLIKNSENYKFGEYLENNKEEVIDGVFYFETNVVSPFAQDNNGCFTEKEKTNSALHNGGDCNNRSDQYEGTLYEDEIFFGDD